MDSDRRRGVLRAGGHGAAWRGDDQETVAGHGEMSVVSGTRLAAEQIDGAGLGEVDAAPLKSGAHGSRALAVAAQDLP